MKIQQNRAIFLPSDKNIFGRKDFFMSTKKKLHFAGIGGIGMSALAQMSASLGFGTTGSDRAAESPENARIFTALKAQGITIYPQDGSIYENDQPDVLIYSTAVESDNPDIAKAPETIERMHRSAALKFLIDACNAKNMIAVTGTSGKTSVTAQMAESLYHLGADPGCLCGGLVNEFIADDLAGNYRPMGEDGFFVVEADESDKSLLNYTADTALVLNIGTDHYPKEELAEVFRKFIISTRKNVILSDDVLSYVGADACEGKNVMVFSAQTDAPETICGFPVVKLDSYRAGTDGAFCSFDGLAEIPLRAPGFHNALNSLAVYGTLRVLGFEKDAARCAVCSFSGVWRRFDYAGKMPCGAALYDDYAHNVEKILSCFDAAKSIAAGKVCLIFQPHGFKPFGFMREALFKALEQRLAPDDIFALLPVYYAGGTSSFTPSSAEVAADYRIRSGNEVRYPDFPDRETAEKSLNFLLRDGDIAVIMGARDNSLAMWAKKIAKKT